MRPLLQGESSLQRADTSPHTVQGGNQSLQICCLLQALSFISERIEHVGQLDQGAVERAVIYINQRNRVDSLDNSILGKMNLSKSWLQNSTTSGEETVTSVKKKSLHVNN